MTPDRFPESMPTGAVAATTAESADYAVGRNRPPLATRWAKGVSGNPHGRPRLSTGGKRTLPAFPDMERALSRQVETAYQGGGYEPVSLTEMLVNELTQMVTVRHNVAAARELLHWIGETERGRAEREAAEAEAAEAERVDEAAAGLRREQEARREAREQLQALVFGEHEEDCDGDCDGYCFDETEDRELIDRALLRLGAGVIDNVGRTRLKPWVLEAALARAPDLELGEADKAALALAVATEPAEDGTRHTDWAARLEDVREA